MNKTMPYQEGVMKLLAQQHKIRFVISVFASLLFLLAGPSQATIITLDADTAATGANLDTTPLLTSAGTITFSGRISSYTDPDFTAAGASGNNFNIAGSSGSETPGVLTFGFDVSSLDFIFGGNGGTADFQALDINGNVVDSYSQASTGTGAFAGPISLTGTGIRSLVWWDSPTWNFLGIDNLTITTDVPEPTPMLLLAIGLIGLGLTRLRRI